MRSLFFVFLNLSFLTAVPYGFSAAMLFSKSKNKRADEKPQEITENSSCNVPENSEAENEVYTPQALKILVLKNDPENIDLEEGISNRSDTGKENSDPGNEIYTPQALKILVLKNDPENIDLEEGISNRSDTGKENSDPGNEIYTPQALKIWVLKNDPENIDLEEGISNRSDSGKENSDPGNEIYTPQALKIWALKKDPENTPCSSELKSLVPEKEISSNSEPCNPDCGNVCCDEPEEFDCIRLQSYILAHGGYRFDKVQCKTGILFPNNFEMVDDLLTAKNLQIYETGGRALFAFDPHWYIRGFYSYGWIVHGHYSELFLRGKQKGNTQDGLGGLGYLNQINRNCALGVLGGWAFDEQVTKLHDANESPFNGMKFTSIWNGPWLGLDFFAQWSRAFLFNLGYEFHLADWRGSWILQEKNPLPNAFSDERKGGLAFGQVVYGDLNWNFCHFWLNLAFKYEYFATQSTGTLNSTGSVPFDSAPISGPVSAVTFVKRANWTSYGAALNLGYSF